MLNISKTNGKTAGQADRQYNILVEDILTEGVSDKGQEVRTKYADGTPAHTKSLISRQFHFDNTEAAILTTKYVGWRSAIKEILLFWQKKTNKISDFHDNNVYIWDEWEIQEGKYEGTIGESYGAQLGKKVRELNGEMVDQVDYLLYQLQHNPASRRHVTSLWKIDDLDNMALNPCVWSTQWIVQEGKLHLVVNQRSSDVAIGEPYNLCQYQALQMMIAQVTGYELGTMTFNVNIPHIYDRHERTIFEQIHGETFTPPQLKLNPEVKDFYEFTIDDFTLEGYEHGGKFDYEVAI